MPDHRASNQPLTPDERDLLQEWWDSGCADSPPIPEVTACLGQKPDARSYLERLDRLDHELKQVFSFKPPVETEAMIMQGVAGMLDAESEFRKRESKSDTPSRMQRLVLFAGMAAGLLLVIGLIQLIWIRSYGSGQLVKGPSRMFDSISSSLSVAAEQELGRDGAPSESEEAFELKRNDAAAKPADELAAEVASPSASQPEMDAEPYARTRASAPQRPLGQVYMEPPASVDEFSGVREITLGSLENRDLVLDEDKAKGVASSTAGDEIAAGAIAGIEGEPLSQERTRLNFEPLAYGMAGGTAASPADAPQLVARSSRDWLLRVPRSEEEQWRALEGRLKALRDQKDGESRRADSGLAPSSAISRPQQAATPRETGGDSSGKPSARLPVEQFRVETGQPGSEQIQIARDVAGPVETEQFPGIEVRDRSDEGGGRWLLKGSRAEIVRFLAVMGMPLFREAPKDGVSPEGQAYGYFSWDFKTRSAGEDLLSTTDLRGAFAGSPDDVVQLEIRLDQN